MVSDMARAVSLQHVAKQFTVQRGRPRSILESLISFTRRDSAGLDHGLHALRDVTFDVMRGECVGIVGRNGSGKSTLLKIIARILRPTSGRLEVRGRVSALLELGAGFHQDLTGRENIFLNASVLGLSQQEVEDSFDSIVAFSELADFIDMPVKHYSSGMYVRLGFSVAIHVNPDVLIVDEVLAVGDQAFRAKCMDRIQSMKRSGATIIIISHNLELIEKLSDRVVWLDNGAVRMIGETAEVSHHYYEYMLEREESQSEALRPEARPQLATSEAIP